LLISFDIFILVLAGRDILRQLPRVNLFFRIVEIIFFLGIGTLMLVQDNHWTGIIHLSLSIAYSYLFYCERSFRSEELLSFPSYRRNRPRTYPKAGSCSGRISIALKPFTTPFISALPAKKISVSTCEKILNSQNWNKFTNFAGITLEKGTMMQSSPFILYSDGKGNIFEDTSLYVTGRSGWDALPVPAEDWIELPDGGSLYELPGRRGIGIDVQTGQMRLCEKGWAVAAFIPPAHTGLYLAAYETGADAPTLPLFCYTAAGWLDSKFYVPATRIEQDIRQDCKGYDWDSHQPGSRPRC
jgi:hypothetical protein